MISGKKRIIIVLGITVIVFAAIVTIILSTSRNPQSPDYLLSLGERFLLEMEYEQALVQFLAVIEIEPNNVRAYIGAAEAYIGIGQMENATLILRQGLEQTGDEEIALALTDLDPYNSQSYLDIADLLVAFGDTGLAAEILQIGLNLTGWDALRVRLSELETLLEYMQGQRQEEIEPSTDTSSQNEAAAESNFGSLSELSQESINQQAHFGLAHLYEWGLIPGITVYELQERFNIHSDTIHRRRIDGGWGDDRQGFLIWCCTPADNSSQGNIGLIFDSQDRLNQIYYGSSRLERSVCEHIGTWPIIPLGMALRDVLNMFRLDSDEALIYADRLGPFSNISLYRFAFEDNWYRAQLGPVSDGDGNFVRPHLSYSIIGQPEPSHRVHLDFSFHEGDSVTHVGLHYYYND